jgi:phosphoserine phosphatase
MDGTLLRGRFVEYLARRINRLDDLGGFLDNPSMSSEERLAKIGELFGGIEKRIFEETARSIPLMDGAKELVIWLRRHGYRVGIVSDSYLVAAEIVRRRVFADFSVAHLMVFRKGEATGRVRLSSAMQHEGGCEMHTHCKFNTVLHLSEYLCIPKADILAVGDGPPDCCLFRGAGMSVAFQPKDPKVALAASHVVRNDLLEIRELILNSPWRPHTI